MGIDCGQTISQPYIVALMTQALALRGDERVLEIGTGSGYQTAILAELAREVVSIERHEALSQQAALRLAELGYGRVKLVVADGTLGWPAGAPYDRILVAAAAAAIPPALIEQLAPGGILVIPLGTAISRCCRRSTRSAARSARKPSPPAASCRWLERKAGRRSSRW